MDYSDEDCQNAFTEGQKVRAKAVLGVSALRGSLTTSANLMATGVSGNTADCTPNSDFSADKRYVCGWNDKLWKPRELRWADGSNLIMDICGRISCQCYHRKSFYHLQCTWNLPCRIGSYQCSGTFENKASYIQVCPSPANHILSFTEGFETNDVPGNNWAVFDDGDGISWETTNAAAHSGNRSVRMFNFDEDDEFGIDELMTDPIEIKFAEPTLSFACICEETSLQWRQHDGLCLWRLWRNVDVD